MKVFGAGRHRQQVQGRELGFLELAEIFEEEDSAAGLDPGNLKRETLCDELEIAINRARDAQKMRF